MNLKLFATAVFITTVFLYCSRDKESPASILNSKTWKRALTDLRPATNPQGQVLYYAVQNCEQDNTFYYDTNGSLTINRNLNKCDEDELQTENQSYSLNR